MSTQPTPTRTSEPAAGRKPVVTMRDLGVWYRRHGVRGDTLRRRLLTTLRRTRPPLLWALRGITLSCHEGDTLGVIGHNGAGKSTLCLALAGILTPDEGTIDVDGRVAALLSLGAGFNMNLSGRANVLLKAAFLGISRAKILEKMPEIIAFAELEEFIDEPVRTYSSGMRARLAFSVAASLEPEIMILDEVLSVGDRAFRAKSQQRIREMMDSSRLIVIVSHSNALIRRTCTQVLWLDHGRMKAYGPVDEVVDAYEADSAVSDADDVDDEAS